MRWHVAAFLHRIGWLTPNFWHGCKSWDCGDE